MKFLPPLIISEEDYVWMRDATRDVIHRAHQIDGSLWDLGRQLAGAARRSPAKA